MPAVDEALELEQVGVDDHVGRQRRLRFAQRGLHLVGELARVGVRLLDDGDDDARIAVDAGVAPLRGRPFLDGGHLPQQHGAVGVHLHRHLEQVVDDLPRQRAEPADDAHRPFASGLPPGTRRWRSDCWP